MARIWLLALALSGCTAYGSTTPATLQEGGYVVWGERADRVFGPEQMNDGVAVRVTMADVDHWPADAPMPGLERVLVSTQWLPVETSEYAMELCARDRKVFDGVGTIVELRVRVTGNDGEEIDIVAEPDAFDPQSSFERVRVSPTGVSVYFEQWGRSHFVAEVPGKVQVAPVVWGHPSRGSLAGPEGVMAYELTVGLCSQWESTKRF